MNKTNIIVHNLIRNLISILHKTQGNSLLLATYGRGQGERSLTRKNVVAKKQ